jgi:hypothetical protein
VAGAIGRPLLSRWPGILAPRRAPADDAAPVASSTHERTCHRHSPAAGDAGAIGATIHAANSPTGRGAMAAADGSSAVIRTMATVPAAPEDAPPTPPTGGPSAQPAQTPPPLATMPTPLPAEAGMSAADRRQVQEALRRLDYYRGRADGIFGPRTRAAIRRFQQTIGAETTGMLTADEANLLVSIP